MEAVNRAFEGARAFTDMMDKATGKQPVRAETPPRVAAEIALWNAEVETRKIEKLKRRLAKQAGAQA